MIARRWIPICLFQRRDVAQFGFLIWVSVAALLAVPQQSRADLGAVVAEGAAGAQFVRVRIEPFPPREGRAFLTVSAQNPNTGRPDPEATGSLTLSKPHSTNAHSQHGLHHAPLQITLDPSQSRHPGLLGAVVDLTETGTWSAELRFPGGSALDVLRFQLDVGSRQDPWIEYARAFSIPAFGTVIFFWHQRRVLRRKPSPRDP
ncbi:MAG: hypothetical protein CBC48_02805 [bacterium TMED88]|nr:hypothetical protein [Deltaproteobacteria bacterium]OUV36062.1 MAG: hypothetical protein CBC48_02805 [bacterium TMED88]